MLHPDASQVLLNSNSCSSTQYLSMNIYFTFVYKIERRTRAAPFIMLDICTDIRLPSSPLSRTSFYGIYVPN